MAKQASPKLDELEIPALPGQKEEVQLEEAAEDVFDYDVAFNFGFVGIGQAGSRIAQAFYDLGYRRVCVIDGPIQDLAAISPEIAKLNLGTGGAGKDIDYGAASLTDKEELIWDLFTRTFGKGLDYILVCASLGGGTGSGGCPRLIQIAKRYMAGIGKPEKVGCVVALPMLAEGQRFARNAVTTFGRLRRLPDKPSPMIIIDNQRIQELFPVGVSKIYQKCNEQTARLFHLFNQLAAQRCGLVAFDRAELAALLDKGIVVFGASAIEKFGSAADVSEAIRSQLERTALAAVDLKTGKEAGCIFVGGKETLDSVPMDFLDGGFNMLTRLLGEGATVHRGVYEGSAAGLRCFTLLAGLDPPAERLKALSSTAQFTGSTLAKHLGVDGA